MKLCTITKISAITLCSILWISGCQAKTSQPAAEQDIAQPKSVVEPAQPTEAQPAQQPETSTEAPKIVLKKGSNDFGKIGPGSSNIADYEFVNEGKGTLLVNNVQSTCGCSQPTLIKDGTRYPMPLKEPIAFESGQEGKVEVTFKAPTVKGNVTKHLYIVSNDPVTPRAELEVKAEVVVNVAVAPESVELRLDQENAGMPEIVVSSLDDKEFSIRTVTISNTVITVPFDPEQKATQFTLKPQVDMKKLESFNTGVIQIATDHPSAGTLLVRYQAKPTYEVSNVRFILQNVVPGEPILRDTLIRSNYGNKAEIESASSRNGYMEIESQEQDGNHLKLIIKITPPERDSASRRYITDELTIALKDGQKLIVRASGWYKVG